MECPEWQILTVTTITTLILLLDNNEKSRVNLKKKKVAEQGIYIYFKD